MRRKYSLGREGLHRWLLWVVRTSELKRLVSFPPYHGYGESWFHPHDEGGENERRRVRMMTGAMMMPLISLAVMRKFITEEKGSEEHETENMTNRESEWKTLSRPCHRERAVESVFFHYSLQSRLMLSWVEFCTMMHLSSHHRRQKGEKETERERDWSDVSHDDRHLSVADFLLLAGLIFLRHEILFPLPSFLPFWFLSESFPVIHNSMEAERANDTGWWRMCEDIPTFSSFLPSRHTNCIPSLSLSLLLSLCPFFLFLSFQSHESPTQVTNSTFKT